MTCTLFIKEQTAITFNKVLTLHYGNGYVMLVVSQGYTQSDNANDFNVSTEPYVKRFYDVTNIAVNS